MNPKEKKMLADLMAKKAEELNDFEKDLLTELMSKEKAEIEASKPVTLDDLKKSLGESIGSAIKEGLKGLEGVIAEKKAPGYVPAATLNDTNKRSFREVLIGIKTQNPRIVSKYELVPEIKFYEKEGDKEAIKALSEGVLGSGGYLVPTEQSNKLINLVTEKSIIRGIARVWPMASRTLTIPTVTAGTTMYWIDENAIKTESEPTFDQMTLTAYKLCCITIVSDELLADSNPSVDDILFELFALGMIRGEETAFLQGTGGAGDPVTGILNAGIGSQVYGGHLIDELEQVVATVEENDGLDISILHAIREKSKLRRAKDDEGRYIYQMPADKSSPSTLWGYDAIPNKYIPRNLGVPLNQSYAIAGDFSHAHIGDRQGIVIKADQGGVFFKYDQTCFRAVKRVGFNIDDATKFNALLGIQP